MKPYTHSHIYTYTHLLDKSTKKIVNLYFPVRWGEKKMVYRILKLQIFPVSTQKQSKRISWATFGNACKSGQSENAMASIRTWLYTYLLSHFL